MRYSIKKRLVTIIGNALKQTIIPLLGLLFSWIITNKFSLDLWGQVAKISLWVGIVTHISSWGNTEYLLKAFSAQPASLKTFWQKCLIDRLPILLVTSCGIAIYLRNTIGLVIIAWCIIEYVYQSYEPVINFYKKYVISVWAEIAGALVLFLGLFIYRTSVNISLVIGLLMVADFCKTIVVVIYFSKSLLPFKMQKPDLLYYASSVSFFLLSFIGLVEARADLIYVTTYLSHKEIAFYQVATTFFLFTKGGSSMLILPFVPTIYRINKARIYKLSAIFASLGTVLSLCAFVAIYFILVMGYKFQVGIPFMLFGFLSIIPAFYCYCFITFLFRVNKQNKVVIYGIISIVVSLALSALLVPNLGVLGAIIASAVAQWILVPLYLYEVYKVKA